MLNESQYIKLYREVIDPRICKSLIDTYERLWKEQTKKIHQMIISMKWFKECDIMRLLKKLRVNDGYKINKQRHRRTKDISVVDSC